MNSLVLRLWNSTTSAGGMGIVWLCGKADSACNVFILMKNADWAGACWLK